MKKDKKTLHDHFIVIENLFFIGSVIMLIPALFQDDLWTWILMFLGFLIMAAAAVYRVHFFKCPHCGSKLNHVRGVPKYCPDCGKELL